jgi:hypothetical protein
VGKKTGEKKVGGGEKVRSGVLKLNRPRCDWRLIPTPGWLHICKSPPLRFVAVASQVWRTTNVDGMRVAFLWMLQFVSLGP